jgi:hypothetical protein
MLLLLVQPIQYLLLVVFTISKSRFLVKIKKRKYFPSLFFTSAHPSAHPFVVASASGMLRHTRHLYII